MIFTSLLHSGKKKRRQEKNENRIFRVHREPPSSGPKGRQDQTLEVPPFWAVIASSATCKLQGDEIHGGGEGGIRNEDNYSVLKRGDLYCGALFLSVGGFFFGPFFLIVQGGSHCVCGPGAGCQVLAHRKTRRWEHLEFDITGSVICLPYIYNHRNNVDNKLHSQRGR